MIKRQLVILFVGLLTWQAAYAQSPAGCKTGLVYENRNPTDPDPIELIDVKGVAKDKGGAAMPDVCVGLFTEAEHKLMAQIATDEKGHFNFRSIAPGFTGWSRIMIPSARPTRASTSSLRPPMIKRRNKPSPYI